MKKSTKIIIGIAVVAFIGWVALSSSGTSQKPVAGAGAVSVVTQNALAPNAVFTTIDGKQTALSAFKGKKVMLWLVATWCSSCSEGARVLSQNEKALGNLTIITLKTYGNAGYPGPSIKTFAEQSAPKMLLAKNWLWGNASQNMARTYNPRNYPDIYFLIDKKGIVREVSDAPAATIGSIIKFANE